MWSQWVVDRLREVSSIKECVHGRVWLTSSGLRGDGVPGPGVRDGQHRPWRNDGGARDSQRRLLLGVRTLGTPCLEADDIAPLARGASLDEGVERFGASAFRGRVCCRWVVCPCSAVYGWILVGSPQAGCVDVPAQKSEPRTKGGHGVGRTLGRCMDLDPLNLTSRRSLAHS